MEQREPEGPSSLITGLAIWAYPRGAALAVLLAGEIMTQQGPMGLDGKPFTLHDGRPLLVHVGNSLQGPDEKDLSAWLEIQVPDL